MRGVLRWREGFWATIVSIVGSRIAVDHGGFELRVFADRYV